LLAPPPARLLASVKLVLYFSAIDEDSISSLPK